MGELIVLLTDVQGSTPLWEADPDGMHDAIARHNDCIRSAVERAGGRLLKERGEGDSTFSVFEDASDALAAALGLQVDLHALGLPFTVRAAVYVGEATEHDGDYFGTGPNRAARLRSLATGGQILVGDRAAAATVPDGARLVELGIRHMRGVAEPERIHELQHPDLPEVVDDRRDPNELIGRDDDLVAIAKLLETNRVVSVVGAGGAGKTSVASLLARSLAPRFADGVRTVELVPVTDGTQVAGAFLTAVAPDALANGVTAVEAAIGDAAMLLLVDNCEHVIDDVASVVVSIARDCPNVRLLTTSRQPLKVAGETVYLLPPLAAESSLDLLVQRGVAVGAGPFGDHEVLHLETVSQMLDGIPLAIELAAARLRSMTVEQLASRLTNQLSVLTKGARDADARHQTMQATLDWSHAGLDDDERRVFRQLALFIGGFSYEGALAVVDGDVDPLDELVERSLVMFNAKSGRYRLLEPVRQYAAEQLAEAGETAEVAHRHTRWAVSVAENLYRKLMWDPEHWDPIRIAERGNIAAAIERSLDTRDDEAACELVGALGTVWFTRGEPSAFGWVDRLGPRLSRAGVSPRIRARAYVSAAQVAQLMANYARSAEWARGGVELFRELGREVEMAWALFYEGRALAGVRGGEPDAAAEEVFTEALGVFRANEVVLGAAWCLTWLVPSPLLHPKKAEAIYTEVVDMCRVAGITHPVPNALIELGWIAFARGDWDVAVERIEDAVQLCRSLGDTWQLCGALNGLVAAYAMSGASHRGVGVAREALEVAVTNRFDDQLRNLCQSVGKLGIHLDPEAAATLYVARRRSSDEWTDPLHDRLVGDPALQAARERGLRLTSSELVDLCHRLIDKIAATA